MPQLPQYSQQVSAVGGLGPGPQDSGTEGVVRAGQTITDLQEQHEERESRRVITGAMSELRLAAEQDYLAAQSSPTAEGFTPTVLKSYDTRRTEIAKRITNRQQRDAFITHADQTLRNDMALRALHFENEQGTAVRLSQANESVTRAAAAVELSPETWMDAGIEQLRHIDSVGLTPAAREEARTRATDTIRTAAARGFAKQDPALALQKLATATSGDPRFDELSAGQRAQLEHFAKGRLAEVAAEKVVDVYRTDARAGANAFIELGKSDLPPEVRIAAQQQVHEGVGLLHFERRAEFADEVNALERSISAERPGANAEARAGTLYRRGVYSPEQYTNVLQAIDESRQKGAKKAAAAATVEQAIAGGQRLDPRDTDVVKAVDAWFENFAAVNHVTPGTDEWINSAAAIANKTNILPPEAMSWARKTLLSGDPALAVPAANAMTRFSDAAPAAYAFFDDPQLKANAEHIDGMVRAGVAPAKAVELARAITYDIPKPRQDALAARYVKDKNAADNGEVLGDLMDGDDAFEVGILGTAPAPPLAMQDEFNAQVRRYYDFTNGDIKRARALAWKDIRGTYGISTVNGAPQVLKYAPELVFPGIDPAVIRADINKVAGELGVKTPVSMVPSSATGDTHGVMWDLATVDEDGYTEILLDEKNKARTYVIPTDTATYLAAQEQAKKDAIEAARAESQLQREIANARTEGAYPGY